MKTQWLILFGLLFSVIIAIFAVANVDSVPVNYLFGEAEWPLILVILGSALLGFLLSGVFALGRLYGLRRKVKALEKEITVKETLIATQQNEISEYQKAGVDPDPVVITSDSADDGLNGEERKI